MSKPASFQVFTKDGCPWGKKAIDLLEDRGVPFEVKTFESVDQIEHFKAKHGVKTTPQIFKNGSRLGGFTDLAAAFGVKAEVPSDKNQSYIPVVAVFSVALALTFATQMPSLKGFMGFSLSLLAMLKLMDLASFQKSFANYDLVTQKFSFYGYIYPFLELVSGLGFLSGKYPGLAGLVALFAGLTGGVSIVKAVYIDRKDLDCACVGGSSQVPLGLVSLSENAMMTIMGAVLLFA